MSRAEELLYSLDDGITTTSNDDEGYIVVNEDRTISVPDSLRRLGVQYDHNIETVTLKCPRYWDDHDMSQMKIYVNYLRPDGVKGQYLTQNLEVSGDIMTFDWVISNNVTRVKGTLSFLVCIVQTNEDGMEVQHWNSELNQECHISEGMECQESTILGYPDIITHLLVRMEETEAVANEESLRAFTNDWLNENHDRLLAEIETKAQNSLDSIPPDYTEVYNLAHDSVRTRANAIVSTKQGEAIFVSDSSDDCLRGLKIFGKTTQLTTAGKNLWDNASAYLHNTDVITRTETGFKFVRASVTGGFYVSYRIPITSGQTVTFSCVGSKYNPSLLIYSDAVYGTRVASGMGSVTYTATEDIPSAVFAVVINSTDADCVFSDIQVEFGEVATAYEPYSGGVASPSPAWYQELESIENAEIDIYGKNILPDFIVDKVYTLGTSVKVNPDKSITVKKVAGESIHMIAYDMYFPKGVYTLSTGAASDVYLQAMGVTTYSNPSRVIDWPGGTTNFDLYSNSNCVIDEITLYPMFRIADATTDYVPCKPVQTLAISHTLRGIPVDTDGNYTDSNGQQWICDEVDFERGVYVQRTKTVTLNGSEAWYYYASGDGVNQFYAMFNDCYTNNSTVNAIADGLKGTSVSKRSYNYNTVYTAIQSPYNYVCVNIREYTSVSDFKTFLTENPITVLYRLKTPIETTLTATELETFKWCHTNQPNTTILNDSGASMEVKYNSDTQTYLEQLPKATDTQVQAAVDAWLSAHYISAEGVSF